MTAKAPHPNVARLLTSYYLSVEGQQAINADACSPLGEVPGTQPLPKGYTLPKYYEAAAAAKELFDLLGLS
jgi:iron(III) transport system substrate-binding protein